MDEALLLAAHDLLVDFRARSLRVVTAESCTGGLIAAALTEIAGSSDVVERGFVTYSNEAKSELLGIPAAMIAQHGAVSEPVARAMAEGALRASRADLSVAVTGVAGPGGGTEQKPVGLVHIAAARTGHETRHRRMLYDAGFARGGIRCTTVLDAIALLRELAAA